jgi:hypothetical protein
MGHQAFCIEQIQTRPWHRFAASLSLFHAEKVLKAYA